MRRTTLGAAMLAVACGHKVEVSFVEAAQVNLDTDLETVMVVNRALPAGPGEAALAASEGLLTGEGLHGDAHTSRVAVEALLDVLASTERFEVIEVRLDGRAAEPSIFDHPLSPRDIARLCSRASCDAIIALDGFDTDTLHALSVEREPGEDPVWTAETDADAVATWRTYDADARTVVDEARLTLSAARTDSGDTRSEVAPPPDGGDPLRFDLAAQLGSEYGSRISPHVVEVRRAIYRTGSPEMRLANKAVKAGNWKRAEALWTGIRDGGDERLRAKARHNLAVAAEARGELEQALALARRAGTVLSRGKTLDYVASLEHRIANDRRLAGQLDPVVASAD